jgi:hypothetical protein
VLKYFQAPVKGACFTWEEMSNNICIFSAGQISFGVISVGQAAIGIVSLGQASVGLLAAPVGQAAITLGINFLGQLSFAGYVYMCQVGIAWWKVYVAQGGINILWPYFGGRLFADCEAEDSLDDNGCC